jgi:hypothetical protein
LKSIAPCTIQKKEPSQLESVLTLSVTRRPLPLVGRRGIEIETEDAVQWHIRINIVNMLFKMFFSSIYNDWQGYCCELRSQEFARYRSLNIYGRKSTLFSRSRTTLPGKPFLPILCIRTVSSALTNTRKRQNNYHESRFTDSTALRDVIPMV